MMRRFIGYRPNPPKEYYEQGVANQPDEAQYQGLLSEKEKELRKELEDLINCEIDCIEDGNGLTPTEKNIAIAVCGNIKKRLVG